MPQLELHAGYRKDRLSTYIFWAFRSLIEVTVEVQLYRTVLAWFGRHMVRWLCLRASELSSSRVKRIF